MLSKRSLGSGFFLEVAVFITAILIAVVLFISFYFSLYLHENIKKDINKQANLILDNYSGQDEFSKDFNPLYLNKIYKIDVTITSKSQKEGLKHIQKGHHNFLILTKKSLKSEQFIIIKKDITEEKKLLSNMYLTMLAVIIIALLLIVYYASQLSARIIQPLRKLTYKFSNMNESLLRPIITSELPQEFSQLGDAFNSLISKIKTSINYRKELFVGTAHELKTPLAVMRLKNQITMMKYKKDENLDETIRETLQQNIDSIDTLNNMIHNILEYGRAEGGQFEEPKRMNIIRFMAQKAEGYELLAHSQNRDFIYNFEVERFMVNIQPLLFMQILQNFIQNALRFSPDGGMVTLSTRTDKDNFIIEIMDEGKGVDENQDFFAPFKRSVESTGAGLGLFIAQNAAESIGVIIKLENREDEQGAIASIRFPFSRFLHNEY
ncbi:HAMP domain-containing histidine kinase [Sulfurovum sp. bin170]|uniref:sensor histidine kinase n=1 Tax=Sulfurovum sp. bin170 TaxID=2695268 RepID=UPI0013DEF8B6|nr:HAMP domain-containing sensor histidine kinase [Sulfurovum sp. bin170]NEW60039.1 HAMP domain-containing histidine kinase [Sulfurovum sp. bin170]